MKALFKIIIFLIVLSIGQSVKSQSPDSLIGQIQASDPDTGQTLTYEIVNGNESNIFYLDAKTGLLYWHKKPTVVYGKREYVLIIKVTDNGIPPMSAKAICTVIVIPNGKTYMV